MTAPLDPMVRLLEACPSPLYMTWKQLVMVYGSKIAVYDAIIDETMRPDYLEAALDHVNVSALTARALSRMVKAIEIRNKK